MIAIDQAAAAVRPIDIGTMMILLSLLAGALVHHRHDAHDGARAGGDTEIRHPIRDRSS